MEGNHAAKRCGHVYGEKCINSGQFQDCLLQQFFIIIQGKGMTIVRKKKINKCNSLDL